VATVRDINRRIRSIQNTQQITRAMKIVAATKLRRAEANARQGRPYADGMREVLLVLRRHHAPDLDPLMVDRGPGPACFVVVTADRGLCGSYNANVLRMAEAALRKEEAPLVIAVGRKARDYLRRRGYRLVAEYTGLGDEARWEDARRVGERVVALMRDGQCAAVHLVFTKFVSTAVHRPQVLQVLPLPETEAGRREGPAPLVLYEPSAEEVLRALLPRYVNTVLFHALLESKASEHAARMIAMDSATENAQEMIDRLILERNRARQAAITREIIEIVSGADALKKQGGV